VITKYGVDVIGKTILLSLVLCGTVWLLPEGETLRILTFIFSGLLLLFVLYFFRDPERTTPADEDLIIAPADGKVVLIKYVKEEEFLYGDAVQVSIFLSPLNVHVNRFPISGKVQYFKHIPGNYLAAFEEKSSIANERTHIGIENGKCRIVFKQIAGVIARRIVAEINVGMNATAGARFGMIKFGSRVDVLMPESVVLKVQLHDSVVGGETVLARLSD